MSEPLPGPARSNIQVSAWTRAQLGQLAEAWQQAEQLPRRPTFDDVIRLLIRASGQQAGQDGGQP